ncbi:hypothetical protein [Microbacterium sp. P01]|uniref:hypothetical protein n=1 Tax=unclassified Microbacterium TaxID=2609290 RepID=UPI003671EA4B
MTTPPSGSADVSASTEQGHRRWTRAAALLVPAIWLAISGTSHPPSCVNAA